MEQRVTDLRLFHPRDKLLGTVELSGFDGDARFGQQLICFAARVENVVLWCYLSQEDRSLDNPNSRIRGGGIRNPGWKACCQHGCQSEAARYACQLVSPFEVHGLLLGPCGSIASSRFQNP